MLDKNATSDLSIACFPLIMVASAVYLIIVMLQVGEKLICNFMFPLWCDVVMIIIFLRNIQFLMPVVSYVRYSSPCRKYL